MKKLITIFVFTFIVVIGIPRQTFAYYPTCNCNYPVNTSYGYYGNTNSYYYNDSGYYYGNNGYYNDYYNNNYYSGYDNSYYQQQYRPTLGNVIGDIFYGIANNFIQNQYYNDQYTNDGYYYDDYEYPDYYYDSDSYYYGY